MTTTNFVFLLAIVTLSSLLVFLTWQLRKVRKEKRPGDAEEFKRAVEERY